MDGTHHLFTKAFKIQFLEDFKDRTYENTIGIPHAMMLIDEICLKSTKEITISPMKLSKFLKKVDILVGRSRETKTLLTIGSNFLVSKNNNNRYYSELIRGIYNEMLSLLSRSPKLDSLSDSLELIKLSQLIKESPSTIDAISSGARKFLKKLEKKIQIMRDRQERQNAGLFSLLNKPTS
jgi:hypothetical protein